MPVDSPRYQPGSLVTVRARDWVVQPSEDPELLILRPLGGSEAEITGIYLPLAEGPDHPTDAVFPPPTSADLGNFAHARLLNDAARLSFRNGAGPFRCLAKLSFRPRNYQMVPLVMALRQERVRLLVADDVGVGKTIEALLILNEMLERRTVRRFAIICLPHLCDQWQQEIRDKVGIDAVVIRSNTQARLDREIHGDTSVYEYYPYQIISVDYIKSDHRKAVFLSEAPELVIVDEAHACARPQGAATSQQQRHALLRALADKPGQHLVLLTATPHSGKPEEFSSLIGLLDRRFETFDVAHADQQQRRELAKHFIQRRRADVEKWLGETTPFPKRDPGEFDYDLSPRYAVLFDKVLEFARKLVAGDGDARRQRVHYWTALGLLRGIMSSPAAGVSMLQNRQDRLRGDLDDAGIDEAGERVHDNPDGFDSDLAPAELVEAIDWSEYQQKRMREFEKDLSDLAGTEHDHKLEATRLIVEDWLKQGFHPVLFCRYIPTADYLGSQLRRLLAKDFPKIDVQVVSSEDPDDLRRERIEAMSGSKQRVLIATDCLSEGINLHSLFSAVLHYDLPWNPNRLEQREGRVDRFGQTAKEVKAYLLFSKDNPVDGVVLDVILRKVREIKRATGINVPFPEDSKGVIDAITQSLLLNPDRKISSKRHDNQIEFSFEEFDEAKKLDLEVTDKFERSKQLVETSRSIFAQNAIKPDEIEQDLEEADRAIGNPAAVETFVTQSLRSLFGVQIDVIKDGYILYTANLPPAARNLLPIEPTLLVAFTSPTPAGHRYIGRNHPLVEQLCQLVLARSITREPGGTSRAAVLRTSAVETATTIILFRCRNVIEEKTGGSGHQLVAEEMLLWGWRGDPGDGSFLSSEEATALLGLATAGGDITSERKARLIDERLEVLPSLRKDFDALAESRSQHLVQAHERFSALVNKRRYGVVYPVLPMDTLGIYVLLPA